MVEKLFFLLIILYIYKILLEYTLVSIGLVSFVIIAQLAPSFFGALFWKRGSKMGCEESLLVFNLLYTSSALCYWNNQIN
jgi:Na+/proline symporter